MRRTHYTFVLNTQPSEPGKVIYSTTVHSGSFIQQMFAEGPAWGRRDLVPGRKKQTNSIENTGRTLPWGSVHFGDTASFSFLEGMPATLNPEEHEADEGYWRFWVFF